MSPEAALILDDETRARLWPHVADAIERYIAGVGDARVAPPLDVEAIRAFVRRFDFDHPLDPLAAVDLAVEGLWKYQVHIAHPRYFGLFNPAPTTMGIAADALAAAFNPQLAAWSHSPFADEAEAYLVRAIGERFGYDPAAMDGTLTSGGAEANHTALLCALVHRFPAFSRGGIRALDGQPVFYVSAQSHHSFIKAARFCGLGTDAVREVPVDSGFRMDVSALRTLIQRDREAGLRPFMVAATAGTTSGGIVESIDAIGAVAREAGLWLHVDAAWGGLCALVPELRPLLGDVAAADSITFDAHKKLSVPMAAGIFLTRHLDILKATCGIVTDYMPREAAGYDVVDPYTHSMQWSRRFIGLKVLLSLAVAGWAGYADALRQQVAMGDLLRRELAGAGWQIVNDTPLPVVCFTDPRRPDGRHPAYLDRIAAAVVGSGEAWLSTTRLSAETPVLRACVTNYRSGPDDVHAVVALLERARAGR